MKHRLGILASAASLVLCAAFAAAWVRSYFASDFPTVVLPDGRGWQLQWGGAGGAAIGLLWDSDFPWHPDHSPFGGYAWWTSGPPGILVEPTRSAWSWLGFYQSIYGSSGVVVVPFWLPVALTAVLPARRAWLAVRHRRWRYRPGRCPGCGYDVRATTGGCPECGRAAPPRLADRPRVSLTPGAQAARSNSTRRMGRPRLGRKRPHTGNHNTDNHNADHPS